MRTLSIVYKDKYKHYLLLVLVLAYMVNTMDRQVLSLLLEDIKAEFVLSDTQLGFLGGMAFAFFYATMGIPLARLADRGDKGRILACCILLWSLATVLCGMAIGFLTLLAARIATAVGEAGGAPTSHALIAEYFPPAQRVTALSIFALGVPLGSAVGNFTSGWVNEYYDWRHAFIAVGLPGLLVAVLVYLCVHDRSAARTGSTVDALAEPPPGLDEVLRFLWGQKAYVHMCCAAALHSVAYYAGSTWNPSFLMRSHGLGAGQTGSIIAAFSLIGIIGTFLGGFLANRLALKYQDQRWLLWLPALAIALMVPLQFSSYLLPELSAALVSFGLMLILAATFFGPSYAVSQALAGRGMRAMAAAMLIFTQTLIGLGLGPLLVGMLSDYLQPVTGARSLAYALLIVGLSNLWSAGHYYLGSRHYRQNLLSAGSAEHAH